MPNMAEPPQRTALPLAEAAERLGLSPNALRMRVARGRAEGVRREGRLYVYVDTDTDTWSEPSVDTTTPETDTLLELQRTELNRLLTENRRLNERLDTLLGLLRAEQTSRQTLQDLLGEIARSRPTEDRTSSSERRLSAIEAANRGLRTAVLQLAESLDRGTRSAAQAETDRRLRNLENDSAAARLTLTELSRHLQALRGRSQT